MSKRTKPARAARGAGPRKARQLDMGRVARWRGLVSEWEASGQSQAEFCRQRRVSVHTFRSWRYSLRLQDKERRAVGSGFVELQVIDAPVAPADIPALEIVLAGGLVVRVRPGFDSECLKQVLLVLADSAC